MAISESGSVCSSVNARVSDGTRDRFGSVLPAAASKTVEDVLFPGVDVRVEGVNDSSGILVVEAAPELPRAGPPCAQHVSTHLGRTTVGLAPGHHPAAGAPVLLRPQELFLHDLRRAGTGTVRALPPFQHRAGGLAAVDRDRARRPSCRTIIEEGAAQPEQRTVPLAVPPPRHWPIHEA
ncbi:hypothetical protein E4U91_28305 [Streptomyces lasalocidi]|uniref:Uncharacterized protein n=1 Tax=Streptomyces lasalocidi TaxID=324833 RepID=A0A4U5WS44_STRLS|nr:hypothetical protein E4U91_28305 [Streptomyces lasalocidi]